MELQEILEVLCDHVPEAIGAVLCDFEGETVVAAMGAAPVPEAAVARAREHVPKTIALDMPVEEFLVRLAGAEPCALLRMFSAAGAGLGAGALEVLEARFGGVEMLIGRLPEEFYVVLVLRRPASTGPARWHLQRAMRAFAPHLA